MTSGTMTNRVDRLTARGFVGREEHPEDRRGVLVRLTAEGKLAVDATMADLLDAERTLLVPLDPADQTDLAGQAAHPSAALRRFRLKPHQPGEFAATTRSNSPEFSRRVVSR